MAEHLIDEAVFGDHPLGRPVLGTDRAHPRHVHARRDRRVPLAPLGADARRRRSSVGNLEALSDDGDARGAVRALPGAARARAVRAARRRSRRACWCASATPTSRTCGCRTARRSTSRDPRAARRADDLLDAARRLDGLAAVRRDPRAARARVLGQRRPARLRRCRRCCSCRPGSSRPSASRRTGGCGTSSPSCASDGPDRGRGRARARIRGRRARDRVREQRRRRALRRPADDRATARTSTPITTIALLDEVTFDEVARGRRRDRRRALGRVRRAAHRGGAGDRLRHWLAVGLLLRLASRRSRSPGSDVQRHQQARRSGQRRAAGPGSAGERRGRRTASAQAAARPGPPAPRTASGAAAQATLSSALQAAGPQSGAFVYDLDAARRRCSRARPTVGRPPASVEKLYTTVALLRILGPNARLHTDRARDRPPRRTASGTATCTCAAAVTRRSATQSFNQVWEHGYGSNRERARRTS